MGKWNHNEKKSEARQAPNEYTPKAEKINKTCFHSDNGANKHWCFRKYIFRSTLEHLLKSRLYQGAFRMMYVRIRVPTNATRFLCCCCDRAWESEGEGAGVFRWKWHQVSEAFASPSLGNPKISFEWRMLNACHCRMILHFQFQKIWFTRTNTKTFARTAYSIHMRMYKQISIGLVRFGLVIWESIKFFNRFKTLAETRARARAKNTWKQKSKYAHTHITVCITIGMQSEAQNV